MAQRGKKVARGKARAGKKRPTSAKDLDVKRIAESVFEPEAFDDNDLLEPEGAAR